MLFSNVMQGGCILSGIDFHGGDIGVAVVKDTKEMCQKHCQDTSGCHYFTWVDDTHLDPLIHKKCYLKNKIVETKKKEGHSIPVQNFAKVISYHSQCLITILITIGS